jgi:hypothetical protein
VHFSLVDEQFFSLFFFFKERNQVYNITMNVPSIHLLKYLAGVLETRYEYCPTGGPLRHMSSFAKNTQNKGKVIAVTGRGDP